MPGGDRTGPLGRGPMTGRAMGYCAGYPQPGYEKTFCFGRGYGRRYFRRGRRGYGIFIQQDPNIQESINQPHNEIYASKKEEKEALQRTIKEFEERIKQMHKRMQQLSDEQ